MAVLLKQNISAVALSQSENHESLVLKITYLAHTFILCAIYRPPNSDVDYLHKLQDLLFEYRSKHLILVGDFNVPSIDWSNENLGHSQDANTIHDIMLSHDLQQVVKEPTRIHGITEPILDLVFINRSFSEHTQSVHDGISDHKLVVVSFPIVGDRKAVGMHKNIKDYSNARDESILDYLELAYERFEGASVAELWKAFKEHCEYCINNFIPDKKKRLKKNNPCINRHIIHLKRRIKRLKRTKNANSNRIATLAEELSSNIKSAREHYFTESLPQFIQNDPHKFWDYLRVSHKHISQITVNDIVVTCSQSIVTHFNTYFHSVFSEESGTQYICDFSSESSIIVSYESIVE